MTRSRLTARKAGSSFERAPEPEPGADIPDEVVEAAVEAATREWDSGRSVAYSDALRAALAAADAKRAELEGQA